LPGEIRVSIWKYTLKSQQHSLPYWLHESTRYEYAPLGSMEVTCGIEQIDYWSCQKTTKRKTYASTVKACWQMYADIVGGELFYQVNAFSLDVLDRNTFYFGSQRRLDCITSLHFTWRSPLGKTPEHTEQLFSDLVRCKNLKHLVLSLYMRFDVDQGVDAEGRRTITISDKSISSIRDIPTFKMVKGLETFELRLKGLSIFSRQHIVSWRGSRSQTPFEAPPKAFDLTEEEPLTDKMQKAQTRKGLYNDISFGSWRKI